MIINRMNNYKIYKMMINSTILECFTQKNREISLKTKRSFMLMNINRKMKLTEMNV